MASSNPPRLSLVDGKLVLAADGAYVAYEDYATCAQSQRQLEATQDALAAARAEVARLHSALGRAKEAALAEAPSWGHRIARIGAALGLDLGGVECINYSLAAEVLGPTASAEGLEPGSSTSLVPETARHATACSYCGQHLG